MERAQVRSTFSKKEEKTMKIKCVWEHNGCDSLLYSANYVGAFTRGTTKEIAISKMPQEIITYLRWKGDAIPTSFDVDVSQEKSSTLEICDADSDVIFEEEKIPLTLEEYTTLKSLAIKSANDFGALYDAIPDKNKSCLPIRRTFYGQTPRTAKEMYDHTKNVNAYYFGEIDVDADNSGTITECRERGFAQLEQQPDFLNLAVICGSYGEEWSVRKVLRRFIWHDRIHAKAMYRMAKQTFGAEEIPDIFGFDG